MKSLNRLPFIFLFTVLVAPGLLHAREDESVDMPAAAGTENKDPVPDAVLRPGIDPVPEKFGKFDGKFDCEKFQNKNIGCEPSAVVTNCKALAGKVSDRAALDYTLQYFYENFGKLRDPSCALKADTMEVSVFSEADVHKGITAPRFMMRDMATRKASQVDSYIVDLCSGDFKKFKSNIGTGTSRDGNGLADVDDAHTTLAGAFLTDDQTSRLVPANPADYKKIMKDYGDKTRIYLTGLNSSNNSTVLSKPMHISPYSSSWGCPSVEVKDADVLTRLVKDNQRSLVMTYEKNSMQKLGDDAVCENGKGYDKLEDVTIRRAKPKKAQPKPARQRRQGARR